jgi:hypothetical protein
MATNIPGPPPAGPPPAIVPPKKGGALKFILIGCGGLVVIVALIAVVGGIFVWHKARQAGFDPDLARRNPAFATAKILATMSPDTEIVSADEGSGTITIKDKKTGKVLTIDVAQTSKKNKIVIKGEGGEELTFQGQEGAGGQGSFEMKSKEGTATFGTGAAAKWPAWVPSYPGVTAQGNFSMQVSGGDSGSFGFTTKDAAAQIVSFYEQGFKSAGLSVITHAMPGGSMVMGEDTANKRSAMVNVTSDSSGTHVSVTYETKK